MYKKEVEDGVLCTSERYIGPPYMPETGTFIPEYEKENLNGNHLDWNPLPFEGVIFLYFAYLAEFCPKSRQLHVIDEMYVTNSWGLRNMHIAADCDTNRAVFYRRGRQLEGKTVTMALVRSEVVFVNVTV